MAAPVAKTERCQPHYRSSGKAECFTHTQPYEECLKDRISRLTAQRDSAVVRLAKHHFGDHSDVCDECGTPEPSESSIRVLQPLGIISESGATLHGKKLDEFLAVSDQAGWG